MKKAKIQTAAEILNKRHPPTPEDMTLRTTFQEQMEIAEMIYEARKKAGLTQRELAVRIGTTASVICRLESGDYDGHSMSMLRRIAEALGGRVEVRFVPAA